MPRSANRARIISFRCRRRNKPPLQICLPRDTDDKTFGDTQQRNGQLHNAIRAEAKAKAKREAKAANGSASKVKAKVVGTLKDANPPKYQNPKTGGTWTGHGRAPAWVAEAKDRNKFLIAASAEATVAAAVGTVRNAKTVVKKTSKAVMRLPTRNVQRVG
jgi:DNA-binding protein H-NS